VSIQQHIALSLKQQKQLRSLFIADIGQDSRTSGSSMNEKGEAAKKSLAKTHEETYKREGRYG